MMNSYRSTGRLSVGQPKQCARPSPSSRGIKCERFTEVRSLFFERSYRSASARCVQVSCVQHDNTPNSNLSFRDVAAYLLKPVAAGSMAMLISTMPSDVAFAHYHGALPPKAPEVHQVASDLQPVATEIAPAIESVETASPVQETNKEQSGNGNSVKTSSPEVGVRESNTTPVVSLREQSGFETYVKVYGADESADEMYQVYFESYVLGATMLFAVGLGAGYLSFGKNASASVTPVPVKKDAKMEEAKMEAIEGQLKELETLKMHLERKTSEAEELQQIIEAQKQLSASQQENLTTLEQRYDELKRIIIKYT